MALEESGIMQHAPIGTKFMPLGMFIGAVVLASLSGCGSTPTQPQGPTAEQIELQNMKTSLEMVRESLEEMADDRDRFQDLYVTSSTELQQRRNDLELLEARHRARLQEERSASGKIADLERSLARASESNQQFQSAIRNLRESNDRMKERLDAAAHEREDFQKQIADLEAQRDRLDVALAKTSEKRDQFKRDLELLESQQEVGFTTVRESLANREREVAQLKHEVEVLRPLRADVARLEAELEAAEEAKDTAVALRHRTETRAAERGPQTATSDSRQLGALAVGLVRKSYDQIRRGEWNAQNIGVLSVLAAGVLGGLFILIALWRGRVWKKRAKRARLGGLSAPREAAPSDAQPAAPRFTVPPELKRPSAPAPQEEVTQIISPSAAAKAPAAPRPARAPEAPAAARAPEAPAATSAPTPAPAAPAAPPELSSEAATQVVGTPARAAEWNSAVTEDLGEFLKQHGVKVSDDANLDTSSDDDALLEDLRDVIRDKFG